MLLQNLWFSSTTIFKFIITIIIIITVSFVLSATPQTGGNSQGI